jgi:hypothetical protein
MTTMDKINMTKTLKHDQNIEGVTPYFIPLYVTFVNVDVHNL